MPTYEESVSFLQKLPSADGTSVYEHLTRVLYKILEDKPSGSIDLLETSLLTKKTAFTAKESSPLVPTHAGPDATKTVATAELFGNPDLPIDPVSGEPIEAQTPNDYQSEDIVNDGFLFDALGVGLGREEMYNVQLAIKKLGEDPKVGISTIRFFGKFFGLSADYYVFETTLKTPPEIPDAPEGECPYEKNTGSNNYVYYVCNFLGGEFTQLPFVRPNDIKEARTIKKFLTGRLTSEVSTYPVFHGTEINYLRAQIARIAATTVCCPAGLFEADEEGGLERNEEWEGLPGKEAMSTSAWVHRYPHLKMQGRCEVYKREPPEDDEGEEFEETEEEQEEGPAPLTSLEEDLALGVPPGGEAPEEGATPAWSPMVSSSNENVKNQVGGVRSNLWPGAFVAAKDKSFSNIYVGWGIKNAAFIPMPPPPVAQEFDQAAVESLELPPKPQPPPPDEEGDE